ncbi:MAG: hypothetical protein IJN53_01830 [Oscillospiraceae bacterium]|nr:hypothetical protein [Oscillospiraceae bacterium]
MMKALLRLRFRALFAGAAAKSRKKKKVSKGAIVLYALLAVYLIVAVFGMMGMLFHSLAEPYHEMGLDWLYFAIACLMGLGFGIIGSVFSTQSQLYDAKDNDLLLSMPIPPGMILSSRMLPLLALNGLFIGAVMLPAIAVYAIYVEFSIGHILLQLLALVGVTLLAQAVACLLGWLLHLLLSKMNKSVGSMVFMVAFLGIYFYIYSQANSILTSMAQNGQAIADALHSWAWPLYAAGRGCIGSIGLLAIFLAIGAAALGLVWLFLSATFLRTATARRSGRRKKLSLQESAQRSPIGAIVRKELGKFFGTPVYLTNMGLGILMLVALTVAGIIFREDVSMLLMLLGLDGSSRYLIILAIFSYLGATLCISTPSVSLEGKNIWILKSLPVASKSILLAKLATHCLLTLPVSLICSAVLCVVYGCSAVSTLLCLVVAGLLGLFNGLLGMITGLKWARLDYISEAYPCKQSVAVLVTMFSMMGIAMACMLVFIYLPMDPLLFGLLVALILALGCIWMYQALCTWGVKKWNSLM